MCIRDRDVDTKDEGIEEFNKYFLECGHLNTFTVQSWSGGYHYYFNYDPNNYKMVNYLTNSSGYRGKGLDLRAKGGVIIGGSTRGAYSGTTSAASTNIGINCHIISVRTDCVSWTYFQAPRAANFGGPAVSTFGFFKMNIDGFFKFPF